MTAAATATEDLESQMKVAQMIMRKPVCSIILGTLNLACAIYGNNSENMSGLRDIKVWKIRKKSEEGEKW
ncbi:unnamed protein product [Ceratitis capitata]|uniref:(Mediterranean fruit fly) hypothetical protein n=1 Tax=Ceratitis capitata TaxID=7213 RepID=A0A811VK42_CERCA|nr:unnamed protein product [Ceratitis capitata]